MATQAQLDEKARQDREGAQGPVSLEGLATPAQLAEKARQDRAGADFESQFATPAQIAEKQRQDIAGPSSAATFATPAQLAEKSRRNGPPPLPPRAPSAQTFSPPPPAYSAEDDRRSRLISEQWRSRDPRSSSTHSLVPRESERDGRRTLLLVFIHGFMGNETSFQSFPAHVHNLLSITLAETHVVHTKIYPRYQSRKAIDFARDDFSNWLEPHEGPNTEVVLLGHSMGGILCADVALQKSPSPTAGQDLRHRILGTINFDTPFLGMHPGVIVSGIGSLFRPAPEPPGVRPAPVPPGGGSYAPSTTSLGTGVSPSYASSTIESDNASQLSLIQSITSPLASPPPNDPFFNPPFPNDVRKPERKGWANLLHFVNKHSDGLTSATKQYFMSHLEFGGCLADYTGLKVRYERIRALEDVNDLPQATGHAPAQRVRFVNYYTASTGRPKQPKIPPGQVMDEDGNVKPVEPGTKDSTTSSIRSQSPTPTPSISMHDNADSTIPVEPLTEDTKTSVIEAQMKNLGESSGVHDDVQEQEMAPMQHIDSMPIEDDEEIPEAVAAATTEEEPEDISLELKPTKAEPALPPIPAMPTEPEPIDLDAYTDKDSRKIAEKEHKRITKAYQQAIKDRESAIKDRKKLVEKREKTAQQEREKKSKAEEKQRWKEEKDAEKQRLKEEKEQQREEEKRKATINPEPPRTRQGSVASGSVKDDKPKRDKKFCMLPPEYGGKRDKCWVRVYMEGVDEVGAHCGLFFQGPQYESLVGDVGERIGKWVEEDAHRRAILVAQMG